MSHLYGLVDQGNAAHIRRAIHSFKDQGVFFGYFVEYQDCPDQYFVRMTDMSADLLIKDFERKNEMPL